MGVWKNLQDWREKEFITDLETEFVRFLMQLDPKVSDEVLLAAASLIFAHRNGHLCINLNSNPKDSYLFNEPETKLELNQAIFDRWKVSLEQCSLVSDGDVLNPLVLEEGRLYLHRLWKYEGELANWIQNKSGRTHQLNDDIRQVLIEILPPEKDLFEVNWQQVAVILSFLKDLVVITGGPGTGKTFTVLNIIAAHARVHDEESFSIALAAPTGKAARRLVESIQNGVKNLPEGVSDRIQLPETALTVHKLLGAGYRGSSFRYNSDNQLPHDLVIIDEASMLDINMWVRLIRAIGPKTKLVILGDKDQLASVEAGSILGDICQGENSFSGEVVNAVQKAKGISIPESNALPEINDSVVFLTKSYRFKEDSGIQKLAQSINNSDPDECIKILNDPSYSDIQWIPANSDNIAKVIQQYGIDHYEAYSKREISDISDASNQKKILCAIRRSPFGVEEINHRIETEVKRVNGLLGNADWYHGRPVMATRNDSVLRIKNGEIGLFDSREERVIFEGDHKVSPARLSSYESAFALTIHKSQGSEFEKVAIILPGRDNPVLSKEILYTSVTRARQNTLIIANEEILRQTITRSVTRKSGLRNKLWGKG
ncbi:MAG: exodeoxyribonuclease V subunit alpha [Gracilimonas sp.]